MRKIAQIIIEGSEELSHSRSKTIIETVVGGLVKELSNPKEQAQIKQIGARLIGRLIS